jgi:membrane protein
VWAASNAFSWLMRALNVVFDVAEGRRWWKRRAVALVAMIAMLTAISIGAAALLAGPELLARIGLAAGWQLARWPVVVLLLTAAMAVIYALLPNRARRAPLRPVLIGAAAGTGLWVLATVAFRLYVSSFGRFAATYGFVGGVIVLLLWLYLSALAILSGAEVAATLEQSEPSRFDH